MRQKTNDTNSMKYIQYEKRNRRGKKKGSPKTLGTAILIVGIFTVGALSAAAAGFNLMNSFTNEPSTGNKTGQDINTKDGADNIKPPDTIVVKPDTEPVKDSSTAGQDKGTPEIPGEAGTGTSAENPGSDTTDSAAGNDNTVPTGNTPAKPNGKDNPDPGKTVLEDKDATKKPDKKEDNAAVSGDEDNSCFKNSLFVGDSRTEGLFINTGLTEATFYAVKGLAVDNIYTNKFVKTSGNKNKKTVLDALKTAEFDKIYLMFGVNELGWAFDYLFIDKYSGLIEDIKELQPDAAIIVQSIIPVTKKKSDGDKIYNNTNVYHYNDLIQEMADDLEVEYIDLTSSVSDKNGALAQEGSVDGVHLTKSYYKKWLSFLRKEAQGNN